MFCSHCEYKCSTKYGEKYDLKRHIKNRHPNGKNPAIRHIDHKCELCSYSTPLTAYLHGQSYDHLITCSSKKANFPCDFNCVQESSLLLHMKHEHQGNDSNQQLLQGNQNCETLAKTETLTCLQCGFQADGGASEIISHAEKVHVAGKPSDCCVL